MTGTSERHHRAVRFRISFECEHVFVNVDDAGRRREQRARAIDLRLELTSLLRIEAHQILYPVAPRSLDECFHRIDLFVLGGDHKLAGPGMRDPVARTEVIQRMLARHTHPRLQAAVEVVQTGVDDAGVARAHLRADDLVSFEDDHLATAQCQRARDRKPDDSGANHDAFNAVHEPHVTAQRAALRPARSRRPASAR